VQSTPTDPTTNRLQSPLASYDGGGNVTVLDYGSERYEYTYDGTNMMKYLASDTGLARTFLYSADDERVVQLDCETAGCGIDDAKHTWTLRGVGAKVLRTYARIPGRDWVWEKDYIHRGTTPLATVDSAAVLSLHADHLDTPRQITRSTGAQESLHSYYPFGQEATGTAQDDVALKFTGHERDPNDSRASGSLDYMHARYCSPLAGRFLSPDPVGGDALSAQSWNRYSYARNNPLYFVDPTGRIVTLAIDSQKPEEDPLFQLFVAALKQAGASAEEIAALTVSKSGGAFVLGTGDLDFRQSSNATVKLIGEAIATDTTVAVAFGDVRERYGGAVTNTTFLDSHNLISITMDPEVISRVIVPGKIISGPLEGAEVGLPVTLPTALVHEIGHARGNFLGMQPAFGGDTIPDSIKAENEHRLLGPVPAIRTKHCGVYPGGCSR
jgi:RHS repeat-associated protein